MAYPTAYSVSYSFATWETSNPSLPKPGAELDAQFQGINLFCDEMREAWAALTTADGGLQPGTVGVLQFNQSVYDVMVAAFDAAAGELLENIPVVTETTDGLMLAADKVKLNALEEGAGGSANSVPIGRNLSGPASATLLLTDAGKMTMVSAGGGTVELTIPTGIATPAGSKLIGYINKIGGGDLDIVIEGTPGAAPVVLDSQAFFKSRNSNSSTITPATDAYDFVVTTGGANCALYIFTFAVPDATGIASGTLGLTVEGVAQTWNEQSNSGAVSAPYSPSTRMKALAMGTVADGATLDIDIAISAGWHSLVTLAVLVKDVPQDNLYETALDIARSNDSAATSKAPSITLAAGNRRMLYAAACRTGTDAAATVSVSGATQLENQNSGTSGSVTTNVRASLAHEAGSSGANNATFTFPSSQQSAEIALSIPPIESDALTYLPAAGSRTLSGVDRLYAWIYDGNNNTFQIVG